MEINLSVLVKILVLELRRRGSNIVNSKILKARGIFL